MLLFFELTTQPLEEMVSIFLIAVIKAAVLGADNAALGGNGKYLYNSVINAAFLGADNATPGGDGKYVH